MKAMRLIEPGQKLKLTDVEVPKIKEFEVLVKIQAAGVCHSDVHHRNGRLGTMNIKDLGFKLPLTLGHEIAGLVEEMGDKVQGFSKGDMVAVNPWIGCGACYFCNIGEENLCENPRVLGVHVDGGYAEYVKVPHYKYLFKIRKISPVETAPLTCSGVTTYRAVKKANLSPSKVLVIIGAGGGLGTMAIQIAKATSGATIIGVDIREEALKAAMEAGADYVIDVRSNNVNDEIFKITDGRGADVIIDLINSDKTLSIYPFALAKCGKYIMVGMLGASLKYPSTSIILKETQFVGSVVGNQADFINIISLAERAKIKPLVTKIMKLEEVNDALDNLENARVVGRQVVVP